MLTIIVAIADRRTTKILLLVCITIDLTDVVSAYLGGIEGLFSVAQTRSLQLAAIAALVPETIALAVMIFDRTFKQIEAHKN